MLDGEFCVGYLEKTIADGKETKIMGPFLCFNKLHDQHESFKIQILTYKQRFIVRIEHLEIVGVS